MIYFFINNNSSEINIFYYPLITNIFFYIFLQSKNILHNVTLLKIIERLNNLFVN